MNCLARYGAAALLAAGLAGCASDPGAPPLLLTLPPAPVGAAGAAAPAAAAASAPLLAVRRVEIPEYLVARHVRYRAEASTLGEWPNTYWAERIEVGVAREFVAALRDQLPGWPMCDTTCGGQSPALTLQVDVTPLDYVRATRTLTAQARMTLAGTGAAPGVLRTEQASYRLQADADTAQAQAEVMAQLIRQIAAHAAPMVRSAAR